MPKTSSGQEPLPAAVKSNCQQLRQAFTQKLSDPASDQRLPAAMNFKRGRLKNPYTCYSRIQRVYYGARNHPAREEDFIFKTLCLRKLHPAVSDQLTALACSQSIILTLWADNSAFSHMLLSALIEGTPDLPFVNKHTRFPLDFRLSTMTTAKDTCVFNLKWNDLLLTQHVLVLLDLLTHSKAHMDIANELVWAPMTVQPHVVPVNTADFLLRNSKKRTPPLTAHLTANTTTEEPFPRFESKGQQIQKDLKNDADCQKLQQFPNEFKVTFAKDSLDCGLTNFHTMCVYTHPNTPPTCIRQYNGPIASHEPVQETICFMEEKGVSYPCNSTYSTPIWSIVKTDGKWRPTIDFRKLNQQKLLSRHARYHKSAKGRDSAAAKTATTAHQH
ncbi:hypothetical protein DPX16_17842 [Anabarilius grahami]|uniref:Uncharacterized protein n=1 Tax=Anabarilius grahami TaxID=495550 RepID=A0A3N0YEE9_ANAGA|nr:hypothetical protein DPX16_17842 [Anabarilius grahami]